MPKGCAMEAKKEPSRFKQLSILIKRKINKTLTKLKQHILNVQLISDSFGK